MLNVKKTLTKLVSFDSAFLDIKENTATVSAANGTDVFQDLYTASTDCVYIGYVNVTFPNNSTGRRALRGYVSTNGTRTLNTILDVRTPASGAATDVSVPIVVSLKSGDVFGVRLYQNSGNTQSITCNIVGIVVGG